MTLLKYKKANQLYIVYCRKNEKSRYTPLEFGFVPCSACLHPWKGCLEATGPASLPDSYTPGETGYWLPKLPVCLVAAHLEASIGYIPGELTPRLNTWRDSTGYSTTVESKPSGFN